MKQSSIEWLMEIDKSRAITIEEWQQAKEIEKYVAQQYAEFAIECYRKELPVLEFDGWINHLRHQREMKQEEPSNDMCECKVPQPQIKVSENGTYAYCTKCIRTIETNEK